MKTKLSPGALWTLIAVGLCVLCFIVVPAILGPGTEAGHAHANQAAANHGQGNHATPSGTGSSAGHNHADAAHNKPAKDSYEVKKLDNGTYTYRVISRAGHTYTAQVAMMEKPTLTIVSNDVILVSGQYGKNNPLSGWAYYYNVTGEGAVGAFNNYVLAATHTKVAYLEKDGDSPFRVVVCNPFNTAEAIRTDLPGLTVTVGGNPELKCTLLENGNLQVTYTVDGTEKVVDIKMN